MEKRELTRSELEGARAWADWVHSVTPGISCKEAFQFFRVFILSGRSSCDCCGRIWDPQQGAWRNPFPFEYQGMPGSPASMCCSRCAVDNNLITDDQDALDQLLIRLDNGEH